jgi:hypothetical protein
LFLKNSKYLLIFNGVLEKLDEEEVEWVATIARRIGVLRNTVVFEGDSLALHRVSGRLLQSCIKYEEY